MNFLTAQIAGIAGDGVHVRLGADDATAATAALPVDAANAAPDSRVTLGIRPEHIMLGEHDAASLPVTAKIERLEQLGAACFLYCSLDSGEALTVHVPGQLRHRAGDRVAVNVPVAHAHLFHAQNGETAFVRRSVPAAAR
jgi:multiple sugar transport system ATP-binding protein